MGLALPIIFFSFSCICLGQTSNNLSENERLKGRVKSVTYLRTYRIWKSQSIAQKPEITGKDLFDASGTLFQTSTFGNGEERTTFEKRGDKYLSTVLYFDTSGKAVENSGKDFKANTEEPFQSDLCPNFDYQSEDQPDRGIVIDREICSDGTIRRTLTSEFNQRKDLLRYLVEDDKGRSWETVNHFADDGTYAGYRYTVTNLKNPRFCEDLRYSDETKDREGNWIRSSASVTRCDKPERIIYQYIEERKIEYF